MSWTVDPVFALGIVVGFCFGMITAFALVRHWIKQ